MDSYREFKKEEVKVESTWKLFEGYNGFQKLYVKYLYKKRLISRVLKEVRTYKKEITPTIEAIESIIEPKKGIEVINTIRKNPRPIYSLRIKCKFQINDWALDIIELIDTGCLNTVLDQKLVPPQYQVPIPSTS